MNFLAHYVFATRYLDAVPPLPEYVLGNALPDLLPLATSRARFRPIVLGQVLMPAGDEALHAGVLTHLATDAAFHKTDAFAQAQAEMKSLLQSAGFAGMRLRPFFLAHVLAELALDTALLRAEPGLADEFYTQFAAANFARAAQWTEAALQKPLPHLPGVLARFAQSRYLDSYRENTGVAEGLSRLCARAHQDTFKGENFARLEVIVAEAVSRMDTLASLLLTETARGMAHGIESSASPRPQSSTDESGDPSFLGL